MYAKSVFLVALTLHRQTDKVRRQADRELLIESGRVSIAEVDEIITIRACRHDARNVKQQSCCGSLRQ